MDFASLAKELRKDILVMLNKAGAGHPGGSLSEIDMLSVLYFGGILNVNPKKPSDPDRDRFILSKGHASPGMYAVLARKGYFPSKELDGFRKINRLLQGHTDTKVPGVEMSAGSLGMGLSFGNGVAYAGKLDKKSYKVWVMVGDGECQEGMVWEAAENTTFHKLDNIVVIVDKNGIQNDDYVAVTSNIEPLTERWRSFGFKIMEIDGHDFNEIVPAFEKAKKEKGPWCIIAKTVKGKGVSFMENNTKWHGAAPNDEELKKALEELR